jgi:nitrate reductase NapD
MISGALTPDAYRSEPGEKMNLSGILVLVPPEQTQSTITLLQSLPGVQVHHQDPQTGRIVVVQEAESTGAEVDGLKRIQALPEVLSAAMVYHYFEDEDEILARTPPELDEAETPNDNRVPPFLVQ